MTWLVGDVFNILGAVMQGVLPTMTILAVYYTFADIVLLGQCLYYNARPGTERKPAVETEPDEEAPLLRPTNTASPGSQSPQAADLERRNSHTAVSGAVDATHLSPATPLLSPAAPDEAPAARHLHPTSMLQATLFNATALVLVCGAGAFGWWLSARRAHRLPSADPPLVAASDAPAPGSELVFDPWGQAFGYLCAVLYLASRVPQLLLNHRRKSTEGVSVLFFLFACVGNLTYVLSILAYAPPCARAPSVSEPMLRGAGGCGEQGEWGAEYARYVLVNLSWLIGSAGTLGLDLGIFAQFWYYRK